MNNTRIKKFALLLLLLFVILLSYLVFGLNRPTSKQGAIDHRKESKKEEKTEETGAEKQAVKEKEGKAEESKAEKQAVKEKEGKTEETEAEKQAEKEEREKVEKAKRVEEEKKRKEEEKKETKKEENKGSVIRTENIITYESIPFETERKDEPDLLKGTESVLSTGSYGEITIVTLVTYKDNEIIKEEVIDRYTSKDPVNKVILVGTKVVGNKEAEEEEKLEEARRAEEEKKRKEEEEKKAEKEENQQSSFRMKSVISYESIPYKTERKNDPNLLKGTESVSKNGVDGEITIVTLITYKDGEKVSEEVIDRYTSKEPVTEVILVGTKDPVKVVVVEEVEIFEIDYPIRAYDVPEMYIGENVVQQKGVKGERSIKYLVTYEDGVETKREYVSEAITKDPVPEIIHTGTKIRESEDPELQ